MRKLFLFLLSACLVVSSCQPKSTDSAQNSRSEKIRILLDTDANNELDDQHAIAYMLFNSHIFDVEGITVNRTSNGGEIEKHYEEAERVVKLCNLDKKIRIFRGASGNYEEIKNDVKNEKFDGSDAVNFIIERAHAKDKRKLVLVPVGKLTNIALAITKDPTIIPKVRIVWLGTNYPDPGEYNFVNDIPAIKPLLESNVEFEMVMVRYHKETGTDAVKAYLKDIREIMPGKGPHIATPVIGRHGGSFTNFGDYSVSLFKNFREDATTRPLFDMAAVAIVKNPAWADRVEIPAPKFENDQWVDQPDNPRKIVIWENFKKDDILTDFYSTMENYHLPK